MPHTFEKICQALSEASMCWSETPKGVFLSEKAVDIAKRLYIDISGIAPQNTKEGANSFIAAFCAIGFNRDCFIKPCFVAQHQ